MRTDFDRLLSETLTAVADRAPAEAAVRAALHRPRRRLWWPMAAVAASVLVVAVAVPMLRVGGTGGVPPTRFPEATVREVAFPLSPTWLPEGVTEQERLVYDGGAALIRIWHTATVDERTPALTLRVGVVDQVFNGEPVDLGALGQGRYFDETGLVGVTAMHDGKPVVLSSPFRFADRATMLRIARGLRPNPTPPLRTSLEFGLLSERMYATEHTAGVRAVGETPVPFATIAVMNNNLRVVGAELTPIAPQLAEPDLRTTVLGHPAAVVTSRPTTSNHDATEMLVVDLGGRWLVLRHLGSSPDLDRVPDLIRLAEKIRIGPDPANDWIGTR